MHFKFLHYHSSSDLDTITSQINLNYYNYLYKSRNNNSGSSKHRSYTTTQPSSLCYNPLFHCYDQRMMFSIFLMDFPYNIDTDIFVLKEYDRLKMLQEQQGPRHTEILLRKEDNVGGRKALKEKFVEIYEAFFNGEDPSENQPSFWEQLFLIKVNVPFLERCIILTSEDHLLALKTLSVILKSIFRKKFNNFGFDILNILCGIDNADNVFKGLIETLQEMLKYPDVKVRIGAINLLNIIVTATEYIHQNTLLQFFMVFDIFHTLIDTIIDKELPKQSRLHALSFLIYLSNFQKYESLNPYNKDLASFNDTEKIKGIVEVITQGLVEHNNFYAEQYREPNQTMASRFGGYLSSWIYTPTVVKPCTSSDTGSCLMMLYELVYQNDTFTRLLVSGALTQSNSSCPEIIKQFFMYCGYLASDTQKESKSHFSRLCLNILICISEKIELEDYFHDVKTSSYIFIYSKKSLSPDPRELEKHPISCYVVDIVNQFIKCNLKGKLPADIHSKAITCIHRIVSYKKKTQQRLPIRWSDTWSSLFSLLTAINATADRAQLNEIFPIGMEAINIFNLFINYGDLFLPQPSDYDDLFYEIIRAGQVISNFSLLVELEDPTGALMNNLLNIKSIISHFNGQIQKWALDNPEGALTYEQVVKIIKDNYETLRLKLQENLDQYERYVESAKEGTFYRQLIRYLVQDTKTNHLNIASLTLNN
eukprot:gene7882-9253_t